MAKKISTPKNGKAKTAKAVKKHTYTVPVERICCMDFTVEASNMAEAKDKALDKACNTDWAEEQPDYEVIETQRDRTDMTKYIVTQADTNEDGGFQCHTGIFQDADGKTQLFDTAEEARAAIADEILAIAGEVNFTVDIDTWNSASFYGVKGKKITETITDVLPAQAGHCVVVSYEDGSERLFTINEINF